MKCPVCEKETDGRKKQCDNCGFANFKKEFLNQEDYIQWMQESVTPCKNTYQIMSLRLKEKEQEITDTISDYTTYYAAVSHEALEWMGVEAADCFIEYSYSMIESCMKRLSKEGQSVAQQLQNKEKEICDLKNELHFRNREIDRLKERLAELNEDLIIESDPF